MHQIGGEISLVAVDLDGTLLTSAGTLAAEGGRLLRQAAKDGVRVVLATTRNPDRVQPLCRSLEINDPLTCTNGAQVWGSPDGPAWACHTIPREVALAIARLADAHGWELSTTVGSMTYWRQRPGQALGPLTPHVTVVATNSDAIIGDPVRILASQPEAIEEIRPFCQQFAGLCYTETYYDPHGQVHSLGIFALQANKGTALALVLDRLGIGRERAMAIGDNPNDLPMFSHARIGVAVANAPEEVKRKATVVVPSNDEEGVARALHVLFHQQLFIQADLSRKNQGGHAMINIEEITRQLTGNAEAMRALVQAISDEQAQWKPNPETWSMKEVMEHIFNEERIDFRKHIKEMLSDPPQPWGEFRHEEYVSVEGCRQALECFLSEREASIAWLKALESPDWDIKSQAPFGPLSVNITLSAGDVLVSWVEHDFLHLRQMIELLHAWNEKQASPYSVQYAGGW